MTNKEIVAAVLTEYSCLTAQQISGFAKRLFREDITPSQVSGSLRSMFGTGNVGKSPNLNGQMVYWLNK